MKIAIYKRGGTTRVWNTSAHVMTIDSDELEKYEADGWVDHPDKLREPEPEPEKPDAGADSGDSDGGDDEHIFHEDNTAATVQSHSVSTAKKTTKK